MDGRKMAFFTFRSQRISVEIPLRIHLIEKNSTTVSENYITGTMLNLSKDGCIILLQNMILDGQHLFFSTQKNKKNFLLLRCDRKNGEGEILSLITETVWMDSVVFGEKQSFKIGTRFLSPQPDLFRLMNNE